MPYMEQGRKESSQGEGPASNTDTNTSSLLDWLLRQYPDTPKTRAKQWILAGRVSVGGRVVRKPHAQLEDPGETLQLSGRHSSTLACGTGWKIHPRVTLVHLDLSLAVVNKGPGLISVPAPDSELSALSILADFLSGKLRAQDRAVSQKTIPPAYRRLQPLPVHRLDQYTTGLFCMATNPSARQFLIEQLKTHTMRREYVAFVEGRCDKPRGTWRQWLQLSRDELRQHVAPAPSSKGASPSDATEAITHFEVLAEYPLADGRGFVTKLRLRLETGRKHQIRVQAANAGLPLVGDRCYNPGWRGSKRETALVDFPRQALHSEILTLEHPDEPGKSRSWRAELPKDLRQLEAALRSGRLQPPA